jgi:hypothetical protein
MNTSAFDMFGAGENALIKRKNMLLFSMQESRIVKLHLQSPIYYIPDNDLNYRFFSREMVPTDTAAVSREYLFGFEIAPGEYLNIEPEAGAFLGEPFFRGYTGPTPSGDQCPAAALFTLEAGQYLFMQSQEAMDWEGILDMALEIQKEGLWEGFALDRRLFLRYVFEDGSMVTQVWRPVTDTQL